METTNKKVVLVFPNLYSCKPVEDAARKLPFVGYASHFKVSSRYHLKVCPHMDCEFTADQIKEIVALKK